MHWGSEAGPVLHGKGRGEAPSLIGVPVVMTNLVIEKKPECLGLASLCPSSLGGLSCGLSGNPISRKVPVGGGGGLDPRKNGVGVREVGPNRVHPRGAERILRKCARN